ncbi:hypothetical protein [Roseateles amylovorans]|uniref:Uncharacterized protein n=1 Tax=Roseateles amylovorans TaxID=2978473 RepID=A0ABY6AWX3_9BURK|nr:hypothetical protein [Roseateles amylovorans]UXH77377.1 hypothetical protein N4261_20585 [Roseateles amylovorans]
MFPDNSLRELSAENFYDFPSARPVYRSMLEYLNGFFETAWSVQTVKSGDDSLRVSLIWEIINEGWRSFGCISAECPIYWVALSKKMLETKIMPSNVFEYCKVIVGGFDLERYQSRYNLPDYDFLRLEHDLPIIKKGLAAYPMTEVLPPILESAWEERE